MLHTRFIRTTVVLLLLICFDNGVFAQFKSKQITWAADGKGFYQVDQNGIQRIDPLNSQPVTALVSAAQLTPAGNTSALHVADFEISADNNIVLIFTNTAKVWRYNTRGDYWILNRATQQLKQIGKARPPQTLMYAKLSPDGKKVAYVSERNIYTEDITTGKTTALTLSLIHI